jgi:hypothetical protein
MKVHPDSLNPRYEGSEQDNKTQCRRLFIENYVRDSKGEEPRIYTHNGHRVRFREEDFYHAFYKGPEKKEFCFYRARKVLWIKPMISGQISGVRVMLGRDYPRRGEVRYYYLHLAEKYLVVLRRIPSGDLRFVTHYQPRPTAMKNIVGKTQTLAII